MCFCLKKVKWNVSVCCFVWSTFIKIKKHIETRWKLIMLVCCLCLSMSSSQAHGHLDKLETDTNAVLNCKMSPLFQKKP